MSDNTSNIYHYTGYSAVKSILENKSLRFSDFRLLNDGNELKYSIKTTINYCKNIIANDHLNTKISDEARMLIDMSNQLLLNKVMTLKITKSGNENILNRTIENNMIFYVFSASLESNNDYMWEKYANNECCIVFKKSELESWFNNLYHTISNGISQRLSNCCKIDYGPEYIHTFIKSTLFNPIYDVKSIYYNNSFLYRLFAFVKMKKWLKEKEYRLGFAINDVNSKKHKTLLKELSYSSPSGYKHVIDLLNLPIENVISEIKTEDKNIFLSLKKHTSKLHLGIKVTFIK